MDYSIIIPSIRKNQNILKENCEKINKSPCETEVIVVSPNEPKFYNRSVKWIKEHPDDPSNCTIATNIGASNSTGNYLIVMPDDWMVSDYWWRVKEYLIDNPMELPVAGLCHNKIPSKMGNIFFPTIPCIPRFVVDTLLEGRIFNPCYNYHYSDVDLGILLFSFGSPVIPVCELFCGLCQSHTVGSDDYASKNANKYNLTDELVFNMIWGKYLGGIYENISEEKFGKENIKICKEKIQKFNKYNHVKQTLNVNFTHQIKPEEAKKHKGNPTFFSQIKLL